MEFKFVDYKSDSTYVTLLAKLTFKYCKNRDGRIYATYITSGKNNNSVEILINQLTPLMFNEKNSIILNLLVNPFFDDLYHDYNIYRILAKRLINANSDGRGEIREILITNYGV